MAEIIIQPLVHYKLTKLLKAIHHAKYFGTKAGAKAYVNLLIAFINNIPKERSRKTKFKTHGEWYCVYKPNKKTSYFITFNKKDKRFIIKNIFNNHSPDYPIFISGKS